MEMHLLDWERVGVDFQLMLNWLMHLLLLLMTLLGLLLLLLALLPLYHFWVRG